MMFGVTALIFAVVAFLPDLYIYLNFLKGVNLVWKILWWAPLAILIGSILWGAMGWGYETPFRLMVLMLTCFVIPKFLFTLISLIGKTAGLLIPHAGMVGNYLGLAVLAISFCCFLYGTVWGWKHLVRTEQTLAFQTLPQGFDGYKIVQITDLHVGTYGTDSTYFRKVVNAVNAENPDLVVFTGDAVNSNPAELDPFMNVFGGLRAKDGVLAILGNHDYCEYGVHVSPAEMKEMLEDVVRREKSFGWDVLRDEHRIIHRGNDSIAIIGVEDYGRPPFPQHGDLKKAMTGLTDNTFQILLSHDPTHWDLQIRPETHIPLTLSGHTHSTQFKVFGWSPASFTYKQWGGLYQDGEHQLYISCGAGGNIPFRFGAWPEIAVLTLKKKI